MQIANAPCSWGVFEFDKASPQIPYTQFLDEVAQAGYEGTELGPLGFLPAETSLLKEELEKRKLALAGAFLDLPFASEEAFEKEKEKAFSVALLLAHCQTPSCPPYLILSDKNGTVPERIKKAGRITRELSLSPQAFARYSCRVNELAKAVLEKTGIASSFHPHCAGYCEAPCEIEALLEMTDPSYVNLCFDTGHIAYGRGNIKEIFQKFRARVNHIHFKDYNPAIAAQALKQEWDYFQALKAGLFCELGEGAIDFPWLLQELKKMHYQGWIVVEQDWMPTSPGTPLASAKKSSKKLKHWLSHL